MRNAVFCGGDFQVGCTVLPLDFAGFLADVVLERIESNAQVFQGTGEKLVIMDFQAGNVYDNAAGPLAAVFGVFRVAANDSFMQGNGGKVHAAGYRDFAAVGKVGGDLLVS